MNDDVPLAATSAAAFEALYQASADPWKFASSTYEQQRYDAILSSLSRPSYASAYEPGCSIGELTVRLAPRCRRLLAVDIAPSAIDRARSRCAAHPNVRIDVADARDVPAQSFDLIVFSELGYYFAERTLVELVSRLMGRLTAGGEFVAVHWLGDSDDHVLHGDAVHRCLRERLALPHLKDVRHPGFRIDTWRRSAA